MVDGAEQGVTCPDARPLRLGTCHVRFVRALEGSYQMTEVFLCEEMLAAGIEALVESKKKRLDSGNTVIAVYLAMRAIEEIARMNKTEETVH